MIHLVARYADECVRSDIWPVIIKGAIFLQPDAQRDARQRLSMNQLISQIDDVISKFGIKECLGLGVGNGAYMLAKYAAEKPKNAFIGLILISPSCRKSSWWEWATGSIAANRRRGQARQDAGSADSN